MLLDNIVPVIGLTVLVFSLMLYAMGWFYTGSPSWIIHVHDRFRHRSGIGVATYASLIVGVSILLAWAGISSDQGHWVIAASIIATALAAFFAVLAYINTLIIRDRSESQIAAIPLLITHINDALDRIKDAKGDASFFYLLDYAPALGIKYHRKHYDKLKGNLSYLSQIEDIEVRAVFFTKDELEKFHQGIGLSTEQIRDIEGLIDALDRDGTKEIAVWRAADIGPLHIAMTDNVAFQYIVIPKGAGMAQQAAGFRSEDKHLLGFLEKTFEHSIRQAITPKCQVNGNDLVLEIAAQNNMKEVRVYWGKHETIAPRELKPGKTLAWGDMPVFRIPLAELGENRFVKVVLVKKNGVKSPPSNPVEIPAIP